MEQEQNKDIQGLVNARHDIATSIRSKIRENKIQQFRMKTISINMIQEQRYGHLNDRVFREEQIPFLCRCLVQEQEDKVVFGLVGLRKLLIQISNFELIDKIFKENNAIQNIIQRAIDPRSLKIQVEACWILANLSVGKPNHVAILIDHGILKIIIDILKTKIADLEEQVIWIAGNVAGSDQKYSSVLMTNGTLNQTIRIFENTTHEGIQNICVWVIANICRHTKNVGESVIKQVVPILTYVVNKQDYDNIETLGDCLWALGKLIERSIQGCRLVIKSQCIPTMLKISKQLDCNHLSIACIRVFGNISLRLESQVDFMLNNGLLQCVSKHLQSKQSMLRRQTAWLLSNIAAGTQNQSLAIFNAHQIIQKLTEMIYNDILQVKIQVAWVLSNLKINIDSQKIYPLFQKIIQAFINLASCQFIPKAIEVGLQGIQNYFKLLSQLSIQNNQQTVGIIQTILTLVYNLQANPSRMISKKVTNIIQTYLVKSEYDLQ